MQTFLILIVTLFHVYFFIICDFEFTNIVLHPFPKSDYKHYGTPALETPLNNTSVKNNIDKNNEGIRQDILNIKNAKVDGYNDTNTELVQSKSKKSTDSASEATNILFKINSDASESNAEEIDFQTEQMKKKDKFNLAKSTTSSSYDNTQNMENTHKIDHNIDAKSETCIKNYNIPCPIGFFLLKQTCFPFKSYQICDLTKYSFLNMTPRLKRSIEDSCQIKWPCADDYCLSKTDWSSTCPIGWDISENGYCKNHDVMKSSTNTTFTEFNSLNVSISQKKDMSIKYNLHWPCLTNYCEPDYDQLCPENWELKKKFICKAPENYKGPCPRFVKLIYLTIEFKKNFEWVCFVKWPCRKNYE